MTNFDILIPYILLFFQILLSGLGIIFLISGIDELFIDCVYLAYKAYRKIFISHKDNVRYFSHIEKIEVARQVG